MAIEELRESRERSNKSVTLHYQVDGTSTETAVKSTVLAAAAATYDGLVRDDESLTITPVPDLIDSSTGKGTWIATISYKPENRVYSDMGTVRISASTTGGSQHISQSLETVNRYVVGGGTAPDFKGAIGVSENDVAGVDVGIPVFNFSVVKVYDPAVSIPSLATLFALSWTTNDAEFTVADSVTGLTITLAIGECLFTGADVPYPRDDGMLEITFNFQASANKTNLEVGDITGITKAGWDWLWNYYQKTEDAAAKVLVKRPLAALVERVYDDGDFTLLDI